VPYYCKVHGAAGGLGMAGSVAVTGGGTTVTVTSLAPRKLGQGASGANVTITGTGFVSGAVASVSGTGVTVSSTSFVSSTQLTAKISIAATATTGPRNVTVTQPGGSGSCTGCLSVAVGPKPTGVSPPSGARGTAVPVTITGTGFGNNAKVAVSGGVTVSNVVVVNTTTINATFTIPSGAATGQRTITVTNKDKGRGSLANAFTVT
jgi:hypothetical protein